MVKIGRKTYRMAVAIAAVATFSSGGNAGDVPASGTQATNPTHITIEQWRTYQTQVTSLPGVQCRNVEADQFECDSASRQTIWIFTREGHPAHPALTSGVVVTKNGQMGIDRSGAYAGSETAFHAWINQFLLLDQQQVAGWQKRLQQ